MVHDNLSICTRATVPSGSSKLTGIVRGAFGAHSQAFPPFFALFSAVGSFA